MNNFVCNTISCFYSDRESTPRFSLKIVMKSLIHQLLMKNFTNLDKLEIHSFLKSRLDKLCGKKYTRWNYILENNRNNSNTSSTYFPKEKSSLYKQTVSGCSHEHEHNNNNGRLVIVTYWNISIVFYCSSILLK